MSASQAALAAALLLAALAGCAGPEGDAEALDDLEAHSFGEGPAILEGSVLNEEGLPLVAAQVGIDDHDPILTDETGSFEVGGLESGSHVVRAVALGYSSATREVDLRPDDPVRVVFELARLPSQDPWVEVLNFRGYSYCEVATYLGTQQPAFCQDLGADNLFVADVNASWRYLVSELTWTSGVGGSDSMRLVHSQDESCASGDPCYGVVFGTHYARMEGEPGKTDVVSFYDPYSDDRGPPYPDEDFQLFLFVHWIGLGREYYTLPVVGEWCSQTMNYFVDGASYKPGCFGWGVSTGIPFDLWLSVFHFAGPKDRGACCPATQYSALPDA